MKDYWTRGGGSSVRYGGVGVRRLRMRRFSSPVFLCIDCLGEFLSDFVSSKVFKISLLQSFMMLM